METDDQDEADTEGVEGELPSQFFGSRAKTDHTNLELNPAMFGARSQTHEQVSVNPIQPSMLDDDDDSRPASRSGSYHETVVDEYLQVAGDDKFNDDDEC